MRRGLRLCQTSPPDVVLTDILMPNQDGLQTIRQLRLTCPDVQIIAMSGGSQLLADMDTLPFAMHFGARRVLYKPFGHKELSAALHEAVGV